MSILFDDFSKAPRSYMTHVWGDLYMSILMETLVKNFPIHDWSLRDFVYVQSLKVEPGVVWSQPGSDSTHPILRKFLQYSVTRLTLLTSQTWFCRCKSNTRQYVMKWLRKYLLLREDMIQIWDMIKRSYQSRLVALNYS